MDTREEELARIGKYIRDNMDYFCSPPPGGLGWPRPGGLPKYYLSNPEEWALDLQRVEALKKAAWLREAVEGCDLTSSRRMAPGTRQLLDEIRRLAGEGRSPAQISAQLDVAEAGVRNVLALGSGAEDAGALGPVQLPEIEAFRKSWGRSWPGGHANGNGHRKSQSAV